ncbi:uncharacterized protein LOC132933671 [Metopolophium dirhodum]|uniref:uncharacterized protein LOC132933671 n=1 Tax=Metopolophium dirhodum TaxID=44670 RepID=UPI0029900D82|nr:uncharacterized protein LOC132933671 [Metopolophium dirhodum]
MQVVLGINDKELQSKLLREDLPLRTVIQYCQVVEQAYYCRFVQKENQQSSVDQIGKDKNGRFKSQEAYKRSQHQHKVKNDENKKYSDWSEGKSNNAEGKCEDEDSKT